MLPIIAAVAVGAAAVSAITYAVSESSSSSSSRPAPGPTAAEAKKKAQAQERKAELAVLLQRYGIEDTAYVDAIEHSLSDSGLAGSTLTESMKEALSASTWMQKKKAKLNHLTAQQRQLKQLQRKITKL